MNSTVRVMGNRMHVKSAGLKHTHLHIYGGGGGIILKQWQATSQEAHVTSFVCLKLLSIAWETQIVISLSLSLSPSLSLAGGSVEKGQPIREQQGQSSTLAAAARLSAMIHGKDRVYANAMLVDQVSGGFR